MTPSKAVPGLQELGGLQRDTVERYLVRRGPEAAGDSPNSGREAPRPPVWEEVQDLAPAGAGLGEAVRRNQLINAYQWELEDFARDPAVGDAGLAALKRAIDASNLRRSASIEELDAAVLALLEGAAAPAADAGLHSETPGTILDRLAVLVLRQRHLARDAAGDPSAANEKRRRIAALEEQEGDLRRCLDELLGDLWAGRKRMKLYRLFKSYEPRR